MSDKVKVEKINIAIGKTTVALELEEAKELQALLNDLFGQTPQEGKEVYIPYYPYPYHGTYYPYERWGITWYSTVGGTTTLGSSDGIGSGDSTSWDTGSITYTLGTVENKSIPN